MARRRGQPTVQGGPLTIGVILGGVAGWLLIAPFDALAHGGPAGAGLLLLFAFLAGGKRTWLLGLAAAVPPSRLDLPADSAMPLTTVSV